jgi:glutamine amidotransferase
LGVNIAIIDYGMGNVQGLYKKLHALNANPFVTSSSADISKADKIILPGVGHFKSAHNKIRSSEINDALNEMVQIKKVQVLGICLGMQLMAKHSEEGDAEGLGWIDARVKKFNITDRNKFKVPQSGWNTIKPSKQSNLLNHINDQSEFFFLHSYHYDEVDQLDILTKTLFEYEFVSAIEKDNIFGTQFHPEKSHLHGSQFLKNFIRL